MGIFDAFIDDPSGAADRRRGGRARHHAGRACRAVRRRQLRRAAGHAQLRAAGRRRQHRADPLDLGRSRLRRGRARARLAARLAAAPSTPGSTTTRRWRRFSGWAARRASCRRSSRRTRSPTRAGSRRRCRADADPARQPVRTRRQGRAERAEGARRQRSARGSPDVAPGRRGSTRLRGNGRGGLVAYLTAGDPDRDRSARCSIAVARGGADVLEVGVPFSDPLADGPVIQRASERALAAGMTLRGSLDLVRERPAVGRHADRALHLRQPGRPHGRRRRSPAKAGGRRRRRRAASSTTRSKRPSRCAQPLVDAGLDPIFLISPTTTDERIRRSARARARVPLRDLPAGRDGHARRAGRRRRAAAGARAGACRRCRWRSGSASRTPSTSPRPAASPTRRSSAAPWST